MLATLRRFVLLVLRPSAEWAVIAAESTTVDQLLRRVILPFALLAPIASVIGMYFFDAQWDSTQGYVVPREQIFAAGATTFFAIVSSTFALAGIFVMIGPMYRSSRDYGAALKVAAYGALPVMIAGGTMLLPAMAAVGLLALGHTLYLFWVGARCVLCVRAGQAAEFVAISVLLLSACSVLAGAAASRVGLI